MKREKSQSTLGNASKSQQSSSKPKPVAKKNSATNIDHASATEQVRSRHGYGMNNEGTNVNYEEER